MTISKKLIASFSIIVLILIGVSIFSIIVDELIQQSEQSNFEDAFVHFVTGGEQ